MSNEMESDVTKEKSGVVVRPKKQGASTKLALVASGVIAGIILAGFGVATAQGGNASEAGPKQRAGEHSGPGASGRFGGGPGHPGGGPGMRNLLHGEGVIRTGEGETENVAMQVGEVTDANDSSVEVKSTDGFTRTYAVNADTNFLPRGNDIDDVDAGDEVRVLAVVDGSTATAKRIVDITDMPRRPGGPSGPPDGASTSI